MGKEYLHNPITIRCADYDELSEKCADCPCNDFDASIGVLYQEIDAFYEVFKRIELRFKNTGISNLRTTERTPMLLSVPYTVNGAFACELALKYLLINSQISFNTGKGHNLKYLFDLLPVQLRNEIMDILVDNDGLSTDTIDESLSAIATIFVDRRYMFSNITEQHSQTKFFGFFVHTICQYALGDRSDECFCNCCEE